MPKALHTIEFNTMILRISGNRKTQYIFYAKMQIKKAISPVQ